MCRKYSVSKKSRAHQSKLVFSCQLLFVLEDPHRLVQKPLRQNPYSQCVTLEERVFLDETMIGRHFFIGQNSHETKKKKLDQTNDLLI